MDRDDIFIQSTENRTRNLKQTLPRLGVYADVFCDKVVDALGQLSTKVVSAGGVKDFKTRLDKTRY